MLATTDDSWSLLLRDLRRFDAPRTSREAPSRIVFSVLTDPRPATSAVDR